MLRDLGYAQTDMAPFGFGLDKHKVNAVLCRGSLGAGGVFVIVVLTKKGSQYGGESATELIVKLG